MKFSRRAIILAVENAVRLAMTFADAAARDQYLVHPDHEKIKQDFLPDLEGVVPFDFEGV